jgi:hypothetical protein
VTNDCNGETVTLSGTSHFELTTGIDADGDRTLYDLDSTTRLTGVAPSGVRYVSVDKIHQHDTTRGGQASNTRSTMKSRLVAQGPTPDLISRVTMHTVINKNGTIVVQRARVVKLPVGRITRAGKKTVAGFLVGWVMKVSKGQANQPLAFRNVSVHRVSSGGHFDITTWTGDKGANYSLSVEQGKIVSTQANASVY